MMHVEAVEALEAIDELAPEWKQRIWTLHDRAVRRARAPS